MNVILVTYRRTSWALVDQELSPQVSNCSPMCAIAVDKTVRSCGHFFEASTGRSVIGATTDKLRLALNVCAPVLGAGNWDPMVSSIFHDCAVIPTAQSCRHVHDCIINVI